MKKLNYLFGAALVAFGATLASCSVEDNSIEPAEPVYEEVFTFDFAAEQALIADGTVEKPGNLGGNQTKGQGFNAYSVKIRNDYKGYVSKAGTTLPASAADIDGKECRIWRRTDRFDQDASWNVEGGLNMRNNREFAIDGLEAGYIVEITYTGDNSIIWAVGENDADGNAVGVGEGTPVATATIDGVEAVPGETAIPSGAKIELKSVTTAVNGTGGYIVLQVKKGQVISKIAVTKLAE